MTADVTVVGVSRLDHLLAVGVARPGQPCLALGHPVPFRDGFAS